MAEVMSRQEKFGVGAVTITCRYHGHERIEPLSPDQAFPNQAFPDQAFPDQSQCSPASPTTHMDRRMPHSKTPRPTIDPAQQNLSRLTVREREILAFIAQGLSSTQIGARLFRSKKTIDAHRASLTRKLGMRNRVQLARLAIASGLVPWHDGSAERAVRPMAVDGQSAELGSPLAGGQYAPSGDSIAVKHALPLEAILEIVMASQLTFWEWDLVTKQTRVSANFLAMMGYDSQEFAEHSDSWRKVVHPADQPWLDAEFAKHVKGGLVAFELEYRMVRKDGRPRWFRMTNVIRRDQDGKPVRVMATGHALEEPRGAFARSTGAEGR